MDCWELQTFEELQQSTGEESSEHDIVIYNQNNIIDIIAEVENSVDFIIAADNVYIDSEFDDNNVIE